METAGELIERGEATTEEALALFDRLEAVEADSMWGTWRGGGLQTSHPMDGMLEAYSWYGKQFIDGESVHPLLFEDGGGQVFAVEPTRLPMGLALRVRMPKGRAARWLFRALKLLLRTRRCGARLRMMEYRGKVSATMVYDRLPILDAFRQVDENTLLGVMDLKGMEQPFFFVLRRLEEAPRVK